MATTDDAREAAEARDGATKPEPERRTARAPSALRQVLRVALELAAFAGLFVAVSAWQERGLLGTHTAAPEFSLTAVDGTRVSSESFRGKRVVLNFWATWCPVCRHEFGGLNAVQAGLTRDEALVGIVADSEDPERIRRFVAEEGIRYPVLLGTPEVFRAFHVDTFPTNYFLDEAGNVASRTVGMATRFSIRARLFFAR